MLQTNVDTELKGLGAGKATRVLLAVSLALFLISATSNVLQLSLIQRAPSGSVTQEEAAASDSRQSVIGIIQIMLLVATGICFMVWFYNSHKNLSKLGVTSLTYKSAWAIGGFFVPFLNFVRPVQVMKEVWYGSDPSRFRLGDETTLGKAERMKTPAIMGWWWGLFLISSMLGNATARMALRTDQSLDQLKVLTVLMLATDFLDIIGAVFAIVIVGKILGWQPKRLEMYRGAKAPEIATAGEETAK
jgi:hypothetical protein